MKLKRNLRNDYFQKLILELNYAKIEIDPILKFLFYRRNYSIKIHEKEEL